MKADMKVALNPKDKKYYVVGYAGKGYYMVISDGYTTHKQATAHMGKQRLADRAAKAELVI